MDAFVEVRDDHASEVVRFYGDLYHSIFELVPLLEVVAHVLSNEGLSDADWSDNSQHFDLIELLDDITDLYRPADKELI